MLDPVSFYPHMGAPEAGPVRHAAGELARTLCQPALVLTETGRDAITLVLKELALARDDEVWILTTFDLPNVSSCVTSTVFNYCKPSRVLTDHTRAIFVIHEFGVPHPRTPELKRLAGARRIPLVEDCAHTIDSARDSWKVGELGDFVVYSFPKVLAVASGGALGGPRAAGLSGGLDPAARSRLEEQVCARMASWAEDREHRRTSYRELTKRARDRGLKPVFGLQSNITPWSFPVEVSDPRSVLDVARAHGVDAGLWHGTRIVVFPCHQTLGPEAWDRIGGTLPSSTAIK